MTTCLAQFHTLRRMTEAEALSVPDRDPDEDSFVEEDAGCALSLGHDGPHKTVKEIA